MEQDFSEKGADIITMLIEDCKFLSHLQDGICLKDNHYEVPLPFRTGRLAPPNNRSMVFQHVKHLRKKLEADKRYKEHHVSFMKDW